MVEDFRIEYFIYAQTIAYGITALVSLGVVGQFVNFKKLEFKFQQILIILKEGAPYALLILLMTLYTRIDSIMLERLLPDGKEQAGIYAAAYRLLDAVNMFGLLFASLLLPIFAKMLKDKTPIQSLTLMSYKLILVFTCTVAFISYFFDEELMQLLYEENATIYWSTVFKWLMFGFIPIGTMYIFSTLMTANANLKALNTIAVISVMLNVGLNYWLIPTYFALGAAIATVITQTIVAISQVVWVCWYFKIRFSARYIVSIFVFVGGVLLTGFGVTEWVEDWMISLILTGATSVILAFVAKMVDARALLKLLTTKR